MRGLLGLFSVNHNILAGFSVGKFYQHNFKDIMRPQAHHPG